MIVTPDGGATIFPADKDMRVSLATATSVMEVFNRTSTEQAYLIQEIFVYPTEIGGWVEVSQDSDGLYELDFLVRLPICPACLNYPPCECTFPKPTHKELNDLESRVLLGIPVKQSDIRSLIHNLRRAK